MLGTAGVPVTLSVRRDPTGAAIGAPSVLRKLGASRV